MPQILRCLRFLPRGRAPRLRPLCVRGSRPIHPAREDLFRALVQERRRLEQAGDKESLRIAAALKVVANAASYGIFVELNRQEPKAEPVPVEVYGLDHFESEATAIEEPGAYFFPPLAALVTGAARLMLALLERTVADAGGSYAFCDTDSMAIVCTRQGGLVPCPGGPEQDGRGRNCLRALSWVEVDRIIDRFAALNPYGRSLVPGSILELERENFHPDGAQRQLHCYAISAKRYCLYTLDDQGEPQLVKWSEHALGGFYLNPTDPNRDQRDWVRDAWEWIVRKDALGTSAADPAWLDRPALSRFTASHPRLLRPFAATSGTPYANQVKPGNFLLVAHVAPGGHPPDADPTRFCLIAPYEPNPRAWERLPWRNVHNPDGPVYRLSGETLIGSGGRPLPPGVVGVKTYRHVLDAYRRHPESKSLGPDGRPCARHTVGLLARRPVSALATTHVGKEANLLQEIQAGLINHEAEALIDYGRGGQPGWTHALAELPASEAARASGLHPSTIRRLKAGTAAPRPATRAALARLALLVERPTYDVCDAPLPSSRARYCSAACRQRAYRRRRARLR